MKIAVVGGGLFGVTTAVKLAKSNHSVDLFEKNNDIFQAASGINHFRLHRGYHYPRSEETGSSSRKAEIKFRKEFKEAVIDDFEHFYCISKEGSMTSAENYLKFLEKSNLKFSISECDLVSNDKIDLCIKAEEGFIDPLKIYSICREWLRESDVKVFLGKNFTKDMFKNYDRVVVATYADLNYLLSDFPEMQMNYQYEVVEKPILRLPEKFHNKSVIILDGPFMNLNPYGRTDMFILGHVVHGTFQTNIGKSPVVNDKLLPLLNNGIIKNPSITHVDLFIKSTSEFMPEIKKAQHLGSMFTIRAVFPYQETTDARPTIVRSINDKIITIFSGKIGNCIESAEEVDKIINSES